MTSLKEKHHTIIEEVIKMSKSYQTVFREYPDPLSTADIQVILRISRHQVYKLINTGVIQGKKIGNKHLVSKINLIHYVLGPEQS